MQTQASPPIVIPVSKPCINAANIAYLCKKVYKNEKIYKIINTVIGNPDDNQRLLPAHLPRPAWHCDAGAHRDSYDVLAARIGNLETKQAIADAVEPWRAKVLDMRINGVAANAQSAVELEAERRCCADGKIVNYVNSTFVPQTIAEPTIGSATHSESTYNPLCSCCSIYQ